MKGIHVTSDIGKLKRVLLHRPGRELLNLTPDTLEKLLFDDIPYLKGAQKEHDAFAAILRKHGVEIVYLEDLMAEVISSNQDIRNQFITQFIKEAGITTNKYHKLVKDFLNSYDDPKQLVLKTMEGIQVNELEKSTKIIENSLVDLIQPTKEFITDPMPNLYFTRDNFVSVGDGINLNHMYSETRNRENIYAEYIFNYHPDYNQVNKYYNRTYKWHTEGGDLLNINEHTIIIGISERTQPEAIDQLAKNYFKNPTCKIDTIIAIKIPSTRAFMHLDTVFTQIDKYTFTYHPEIIKELQVYEITEGLDSTVYDDLVVKKIEAPLDKILEKYLNHPVKLIPCAGGNEIASKREQWNDGSNTLCLEPGVVVVYNRNEVTNKILRQEGITVIEIPSSELSRGRGGPRCMSMPLEREDIIW